MLSNNGSCLRARSCAVRVTIFSNGSIIPPGFKFTKLRTLTLAARFYALLPQACSLYFLRPWPTIVFQLADLDAQSLKELRKAVLLYNLFRPMQPG